MRTAVFIFFIFISYCVYGEEDYLIKKEEAEQKYGVFMRVYEELYFWDKVSVLWEKFRMQLIISRMGKYHNKIIEAQDEGEKMEYKDKIMELYDDFINLYLSLQKQEHNPA